MDQRIIATNRHKSGMKTQNDIFQSCDQAICDDIRPHPDPLPHERANYLSRFNQYQHTGLSCLSRPMAQNWSWQRRTSKLSSAVTLLSLSLGERVGVRASVNAISTENIEELKVKNTSSLMQFNFALFAPFCG